MTPRSPASIIGSPEYNLARKLAAWEQRAPRDWHERLVAFADEFCGIEPGDFDKMLARARKRARDAERRRAVA